ncbi:MAG: altronate dehydratase family protein, partial [Selenomonadaceae bacterium]|nr:altronate dehydratase family protein [Selenomonadaceae bacterium]
MADLKVFRIHSTDNVAVSVAGLKKGETVTVDGQEITPQGDIPAGHKMAIKAIKKGEDVIKYGFPIGTAKEDVVPGTWMHTHNVKSKLGDLLDYKYEPDKAHHSDVKLTKDYTFDGYLRADGRVGIRNEVWIVPTVGCVNAIARTIESQSQQFRTEHIDGIYAYSHPHGCSQLDGDQERTQKILSGLVHSPNAGAVLVLSLGCENNQVALMKQVIGDYDPERVKFLVCQDVEDEIAAGVKIMQELCQYADQFTRTPQPLAKLTIGLKCGGNDGFSGITANPLVGSIAN